MINLLEQLSKMKLNESNTLVVVDVQPSHKNYIHFNISDFCEYLNNHQGNIHYLFNGTEQGYENVNELKEWLLENGLDEDLLYSINFIEKSYGWLRGAIDSGMDETDIIKIFKYLYKEDINSSQDIDEEVYAELNIDSSFVDNLITGDITISQPSIIEELQDLPSSGTIIGGGKDECLLEVELTLQALNKNYTRYNKFVY